MTYNELNRRVVLGSADALVCVTHELAESENFTSFGKRTIVIGNGVDLERLRELPAPTNERAQVVFLGSARQSWHGIDKIGWLAARLHEADFHVIGYHRDSLPFRAPPNLTAHGILGRDEYEPLLARADLAVGTLALHRKRMNEACPLKVREYLAYGLPVVIGYRDTDFANVRPWYLLELPNSADNVRSGLGEIRAFLAQVRGRRVPRADVTDRIGAAAKEWRRLELFAEITRQRG